VIKREGATGEEAMVKARPSDVIGEGGKRTIRGVAQLPILKKVGAREGK